MLVKTRPERPLIIAALAALMLCVPAFAAAGSGDARPFAEMSMNGLDSYRARLAELERTVFAAEQERRQVLEALYAELEHVSPSTKSAGDCQTACSLLTTALNQLESARVFAKFSWIGSCPFSPYGQLAVSLVHEARNETQVVKNATCDNQSCSLSALTRARDLALDTWIMADNAVLDGCDADMANAAYEAGQAWATLTNAEHACSHC
ncbi:MAG: hypothetical protein AAGC60_23335 [Acidobacteriota bacterium]